MATSRDIQPKKTSKKMPQKKDFQWTDDEAELLLSTCYDYKSAKALDGVEWESVKSKYEDNIAECATELLENWKLNSQNLVAATTDNGSKVSAF